MGAAPREDRPAAGDAGLAAVPQRLCEVSGIARPRTAGRAAYGGGIGGLSSHVRRAPHHKTRIGAYNAVKRRASSPQAPSRPTRQGRRPLLRPEGRRCGPGARPTRTARYTRVERYHLHPCEGTDDSPARIGAGVVTEAGPGVGEGQGEGVGGVVRDAGRQALPDVGGTVSVCRAPSSGAQRRMEGEGLRVVSDRPAHGTDLSTAKLQIISADESATKLSSRRQIAFLSAARATACMFSSGLISENWPPTARH
jgi:hypothetical protein